MIYKTEIFVGEVTDLSFARYTAGMMIDRISFLVSHSDKQNKDALNVSDYQDIIKWIQGVPLGITLTLDNTLDISSISKLYNPDFFHIKLPSLQNDLECINHPFFIQPQFDDLMRIKELINTLYSLQNNQHVLGIILDDAIVPPYTSLKVKPFDNTNKIPVYSFLDDAFSPRNNAIENKFQGVYIKSPKETSVGIADYDKLDSLLKSLEN